MTDEELRYRLLRTDGRNQIKNKKWLRSNGNNASGVVREPINRLKIYRLPYTTIVALVWARLYVVCCSTSVWSSMCVL
jgi:hypothetical protein